MALDHEMRRLGEETNRSNARLSSAKLELERLQQERAMEKKRQARETAGA